MIVDCCADLHGHYPELEGGDLLIVAGDLTATDTLVEHYQFGDWLKQQHYEKKVVVAGNHDTRLQHLGIIPSDNFHHCSSYLCDSGTEFEWFETEDTKWGPRHLDGCRHLKLKIWGSPWTKTFEGMNPHCKAFTVDTEEELDKLYYRIPSDIDILITHGAPRGILDEVDFSEGDSSAFSVGSHSLLYHVRMRQPKLHVFGHIHDSYGIDRETDETIYVNASHVNEHYQPVNKPIRVIL